MAYGTVKTDTIIFDQGGADQNVTVSGIYRAITSGVTVSGTISGAVLIGTTTVSGATVTGTQSSFTSGNFVTLSGVTATFTSGVIASGTAAAPSLSIVSDPNTGLYSPGADQVALATAGTGRLFVDGSGRLSLGVSSTSRVAEFACASGNNGVRITNNANTASDFAVLDLIQAASQKFVLYTNQENTTLNANTGALIFQTGAAERLRIDSSGSVGIGTSSPQTTLDIAAGGMIRLTSTSGNNMIQVSTNSGANGLGMWAGGAPRFYSTGNMTFSVNSTIGTGIPTGYVDAMTIDSSGRVGIGTASDGSKLLVYGEGTTANTLSVVNPSVTNGAVLYLGDANEASAIKTIPAAGTHSLGFFVAGASTERMRISSSGRVGIGTSSPNARLEVSAPSAGRAYSSSVLDFSNIHLDGITSNTTTSALTFASGGGGGAAVAFSRGSSSDTQISFWTNLAGGANVAIQRMVIDSSGRVGIGTDAPGVPLEVAAASSAGASTVTRFRHDNGADQHYLDVSVNPDTDTVKLISSGSANGSLVLGTQAVDTLTTTSAGNVGIGTTSPGELLELSATTDPKIQFTDVGNVISKIGISASTALTFEHNGSERLRIDSSGNVGIGTSAPVSQLHLAAAHTLAPSSQLVLIQNTTTGEPASLVLQAVADNGGIGNTGAIYFDAGATGVTSDNSLQFTAQHQETITPAMTLTGLGRLGIGTSAPTAKLHVETIPASINQSGSVLFGPDTSYGFEIRNVIDGSGFPSVELRAPTAGNAPILFFAAGSTEKARIDNLGRLLVGSSSARSLYGQTGVLQTEGTTYLSSGINLILNNPSTAGPLLMLGKSRGSAIGSNTIVQNGDTLGSIYFCGADGSDLDTPGGGIYCEVDGTPGVSNDMPGRLVFATTADGAGAPTERMRITNGGNVLFNATAVVEQGLVLISYNGGVNQGAIFAESDTTSGNTAIRFKVAGSTVGSITTTSSATAYNTSSDYRLKENVTAVNDGITRLQQLKPSRFNFIADPNHTVDGFIAHEVQDIVPEAITGEKDAEDDDGNFVYQGIDQSKLVPLLTAALQEAIGKIETLEARLTAAGID